ncbi:helix-turn-helix domain-containing protein [Paenibacillus septentrionalis]|uniref:Helix-turn-helix domain-containing protein n=1 Tax=Paenibacillus septentrionalis TaxID=429342 RepID=A0ABW1UYQ3_9BACL
MLGERLVKLRGKRTQKQIASLLGISRARYSHYENNHVQPSNELLQKMSDLHGVSIDYLLGRSESELNQQEQQFLQDVTSVPLDEILQKYPLEFMGEKLDFSDDDKRAILAFIKTLHELKRSN